MDIYGYVRISSKDQNPDRQLIALKNDGIPKERIYMDRQSGKDFNRPMYQKMIKKIKRSDIVVIKSVDRLGRDYEEILREWRRITFEKGADIHVIDMPLLNTDSVHGDLTGKLISDLVLQILAYVAETERVFIRKRQAEGIAAAKGKGVKFGAKRIEMPKEYVEYYKKWVNKEITTRDAAKELNISSTTFYRRCKEMQHE